ncbi:MAG: hypothetical protein ACI308_04080 [Muribaculaceae bacterium]
MNKNLRLMAVSTAVMMCMSCFAQKTVDFTTDYFGISINSQGYVTSMRNITVKPHREFSAAQSKSPLLSLYDSEKKTYFMPVKSEYNKVAGTFNLTFENGSKARVKVEPKQKYIKLTLECLDNRGGVDAIQWGTYRTSINNLMGDIIGVARDTSEVVNYAIGVLALNDNTIGGTANIEGDAPPFQYVVHTPDAKRFPLPEGLVEGQEFSLGGDGISDVAFYSKKEPYYRITYGNAAMVDSVGNIGLSYMSRDRRNSRQVFYSLIPKMPANIPNHIYTEALPDVDVEGSSVAFWGSPDSIALMDVIQDVVLREGLPYPTVNGRWVKDPAAYSPDVMCAGGEYEKMIEYNRALGFPAIHAYDQGFLRPNRANEGYLDGKDGSRKPFKFGDTRKNHREFADMAAAEGMMLGRVCITNSLAPGTKDASPVPSDSLCYQQRRTLMCNISATDTIIEIDDPAYLNEIASWEGHCVNLNMVKIGKELIHYRGVTDTEPYRLKNVKRGYWNTAATDHSAGDVVDKLQVTVNYGYDGIIPNMALQDEIARYYAEVAKKCGVTMYDFDGQEFLFNNGHGYYSVKRFFRNMFEHAAELGVPYLRFSGATLSEGSWHYQSMWNVGGGRNLYDIDTREWGSSTSQGKDLRDVTYSNYYPCSFGGNFAVCDTSRVEQYEHVEAIACGYGATYFLSLNQKDVEKCPQKDAIFAAIRTWENARHANAFPRHIKKLLMRPEYDWHLEAKPDGDHWTLHRMENGKSVQRFELSRAAGY